VTEQKTSVPPSELEDFFEKYNRGLRIVVEGAQAETGQTPKATVWTKNKAKLYRYEPEKPRS
jgi:polyhydroxyalkanoate synthase